MIKQNNCPAKKVSLREYLRSETFKHSVLHGKGTWKISLLAFFVAFAICIFTVPYPRWLQMPRITIIILPAPELLGPGLTMIQGVGISSGGLLLSFFYSVVVAFIVWMLIDLLGEKYVKTIRHVEAFRDERIENTKRKITALQSEIVEMEKSKPESNDTNTEPIEDEQH